MVDEEILDEAPKEVELDVTPNPEIKKPTNGKAKKDDLDVDDEGQITLF